MPSHYLHVNVCNIRGVGSEGGREGLSDGSIAMVAQRTAEVDILAVLERFQSVAEIAPVRSTNLRYISERRARAR